MRKAKGLLVRFMLIVGLLFTALIPNSASAEKLGHLEITTKDFYVEDGKLKEFNNSINKTSLNKASLPPLDELIPDDAYVKGLPSNTLDFPAKEITAPIDYLALVFNLNGKNMTAGQLFLHAPDADLYVFKTSPDDEMPMQLSHAEMETYPPGNRIYPAFGEDIEVRYYKDHPLVDQAKIQFVGYWELVGGKSLSSNTGSRISESYTMGSGIDITEAYELASTIGVTIGSEVGFDYAKLSAELSHSITETFGYSQTISQIEEVTTTFNFGNEDPNGIPYIGGVYQLKGEYLVKEPGPDLKIRLDFLNSYGDFPAKLKPDFYYDNNHYRQIQADYIEPDA
ncbi:hypothetical protein [Jeotgalibacillus marinus]|uniref:Uncharacterized protein n=1 Tax=Jeotgalibacillus marinus TaxID=86667 RepID=A0ABV3Q7H0_9BACL